MLMIEATTSANLTITTLNSLTTTNIIIGSAAGSGIITIIFKIIEKLWDRHIDHEKLIYTDKRQLADALIKICAEGDRKHFQKNAKDGQNIVYVANQIAIFDEISGKDLLEYQILWDLAVTFFQRRAPGDIEAYQGLTAEAIIKRDGLLKLARKWKK